MPSDIVETAVMGDITFVTTTTPDSRSIASSARTAIPTKEMKAYRESLTTACSFCHKAQRDKLVCAKVHFMLNMYELELIHRSARSLLIALKRFGSENSPSDNLSLITIPPAYLFISCSAFQ